jgi:opacity protein-like surface antigen
MAKQFVFFCSVAILLISGLASAQNQPEEKVFNLVVGESVTEEVAEDAAPVEAYIPAIEPGSWDLTLTLGYFLMEKRLLQYDKIVYKTTNEHLYYGDVELVSQSAFNPILRLGYHLTAWLGLETQLGMTFSEMRGSIANPHRVAPIGDNAPEELETIGVYDPQNRSTLVFLGNLNGVLYPFNLDGDGRGRFHPYITGGLGYAYYNLDTDYIDDPATSININAGLGVNFIADKLITLRGEILYHRHTIEFEPAAVFDSRDDGTVLIPVYRFDDFGNYRRVESYRKTTMSGLTWQVGFAVNF